MKRILLLSLTVLFTLATLAGCGGTTPTTTEKPAATGTPAATTEAPFPIAIVLSVGGLGDGSYNDNVWEGFQQAKESLNVDIQLVEPTEVAEIQGHFIELARSGKYKLIFGVGADCEESVVAAAAEFPDQHFVIMDSMISDKPNITAVKVSGPSQCFVAGVIAALYTETNNIGVVLGMDVPAMADRATAPFIAGVKYINPEIEVKTKFTGSWTDTNAGKELAIALNQEGCDVIMPYAGGAGLGVFNAAKEKNFYVIGAGSNQNNIEPKLTVASGVFFFGPLAYQCITSAMDGTLESGLIYAGLKEGGVGYTTEGSEVPMSDEIVARIAKVVEKVSDGTIIVPELWGDLEKALENNAGK